MKINVLYIVWLIALMLCFVIIYKFAGQTQHTFFGTAESESQILNYEYSILVEKIYVQTGDQVKQGDTLAVFMRSDLDRTASDKSSEINQYEVEKLTKNNTLQREIDVLRARRSALVSELESQIKMINTEDGIQSALKEAMGDKDKSTNKSNLKNEKIASLNELIKQTERQIREQGQLLNEQIRANESVYDSKVNQVKKEIGFLDKERDRLTLLSPIDGFVENVGIMKNEIAPQYKELIRLNPKLPNKVRGFISESAELVYRLGDSVMLTSSTRPIIVSKGVLIGSSPQLVELPFRLRKFTEVRAWGREIYIRMPLKNDFFIGEKIIISIENK